MNKIKDAYDIVIIGAGVGGLICGCYLAKAGKKVLIVEKNSQVGGYCSSFKRNGYTLDNGLHALVNCRKDGIFGKIIEELEIRKKINILKSDVSDVILTPDYSIKISNDHRATIDNIKKKFWHESKNIQNFINFITQSKFISLYAQLKNITFDKLLSTFFSDAKLRSFFGIVNMNIGLSPQSASALASIILVKEHLFDNGYFMIGGIQQFPDACARIFVENGGDLLLSKKVDSIVVKDNKVEGVMLCNGSFVCANFVVSACDAIQTFFKLIGREKLNKNSLKQLNMLKPSYSCFVVHICLNKKLNDITGRCRTLWYSDSYDFKKYYNNIKIGKMDKSFSNFVCVFPSLHDSSLAPKGTDYFFILVTAPYQDKEYWLKEKGFITDKLIKKAEKILPHFAGYITETYTTTPVTFEKYTLNHMGAYRGWASTVSQYGADKMPQQTQIEGLYLAGHWATTYAGQGGVSVTAYSGLNAAKLILKKYKNK